MHLSQTTFVVVDLETSGAAPSSGAGITEIGAVKVRGGEVIGEFETFVNPGVLISDFITQLTGITDQMLANAPTIGQVFPSFIEFLGPEDENVLVAHNAPFDVGFLKAAAAHLDPSHRALDDARATVDVLHGIIERLGGFGITTLPQFKKVKKRLVSG
jgi:DNA polymerase III epsilon subunit family exonuclease